MRVYWWSARESWKESNQVDLVIEIQQSLDLKNFSKIVLDPSRLRVDGNGDIRYRQKVSDDKKFFQATWK